MLQLVMLHVIFCLYADHYIIYLASGRSQHKYIMMISATYNIGTYLPSVINSINWKLIDYPQVVQSKQYVLYAVTMMFQINV